MKIKVAKKAKFFMFEFQNNNMRVYVMKKPAFLINLDVSYNKYIKFSH